MAKLNALLGKVSWLNRLFLNKALLICDFHVLLAFHVLSVKLINYTQRRKQVWGMENKTQLRWYRKVQCVPFWFGLIGLGTIMAPVTWSVYWAEERVGMENAGAKQYPNFTPCPPKKPPQEILGSRSLFYHQDWVPMGDPSYVTVHSLNRHLLTAALCQAGTQKWLGQGPWPREQRVFWRHLSKKHNTWLVSGLTRDN